MPALKVFAAAPRLAIDALGFPVSMGNCPDLFRYHPIKGIGQRSFFARILNCTGSAANTTGVSI
jgi:hypothetical protein